MEHRSSRRSCWWKAEDNQPPTQSCVRDKITGSAGQACPSASLPIEARPLKGHVLSTCLSREFKSTLHHLRRPGKVERHGGFLKATLRRVAQESQIEGVDGIKEALSECVSVKNDLTRHHGYSPSQHVFGKAPRRPGSMLDDTEDLGTLEAMTDETSPFWTCCQARAEAKKAFLRLETSKRVAKALAKNAAPVLYDYQIGDLFVYRRDNVPGVSGTVWSTTSRVIGKELEFFLAEVRRKGGGQ